jgi:hypothetical protein
MRFAAALAVVLLSGMSLPAGAEKGNTTTFKKESLDKVPAGWKAERTGKGEGSIWKVIEDASGPGRTGLVLAQIAASPSSLFNICVVDDSSYQNVEVIVAFKANHGKKDQGGGIVWRYQDANNYYVARINPLEDNFRVYKVVAGKRSAEFQDAEVKIPEGEWHTLKIKMVGDHIECFADGKKYVDVKDGSITKAGKVGLWTKADAQTSFDQFRAVEIKK